MGVENLVDVVFAKYCPLLVATDSGNLVKVHFDVSESVLQEAYCNHTGVPRVEKKEKILVACDGCEEFVKGFEKPLENSRA